MGASIQISVRGTTSIVISGIATALAIGPTSETC